MKVFTNIILAAFAIILAINLMSKFIDRSAVQQLKETFVEEPPKMNNYTLIPKFYGLDTIKVQAQKVQQLISDKKMYGKSEHTEYYVFIGLNNILCKYE